MIVRKSKSACVLDKGSAWLGWGFLLMLVLQPFVAGFVPPITAFHSNRHLLLPLLIPIALYSLWRRRLALVPAVLGLGVWLSMIPSWLGDPAPRDGEPDLRVVTINLGHLRSDPQRVAGQLSLMQADLVVLQEVNSDHEYVLRERLAQLYPHQAWYSFGVPGKALLTRFPILREELVELAGGTLVLFAWLDIEEYTVHVANIHHRAWVSALGRMSTGVRELETWAIQQNSVEDVDLFVGDFNSVPGSAVLRAFAAQGFESAFDEVGGGAGFTFPVAGRYRGWPGGAMYRLDHVLYGPDFEVLSAEVGSDVGSDHLPLIANLRFRLPPR